MPSAREVLASAKRGELAPVYLLMGEERFVRDELVDALRTACLQDAIAAFNEDRLVAGDHDIHKVLGAAKTLPMMAPKRFVLVRQVERWDGASGEESRALEELATYIESPSESTCLVLLATKLDGRRKLVNAAKKKDMLVDCGLLPDRDLPAWVLTRAESLGHAMDRDVAQLLAAVAGPDLGSLNDCVERLGLYVEDGAAITEAAVVACVARVRVSDTWALVDAVSARDLGQGLRCLKDAYDPRDRGLPLLGALAWSIRQLARYHAARESGARPDEAAKRAGVFHPGRARELERRVGDVKVRELERWFTVLAEADLALKGSKRPPEAVLEDMITRLTRRVA